MTFSYHTTIDIPLDLAMKIFMDPNQFKFWQRDMISSISLSSQPGTVGSRRRIKLKTPVGTITMTELITKRELPHLWEATYRSKGVVNYQSNRFRESVVKRNDQTIKQTLWECQSIFKFTGMMRIVAAAKPELFGKQGETIMKDFKKYAESLNYNLHDSQML